MFLVGRNLVAVVLGVLCLVVLVSASRSGQVVDRLGEQDAVTIVGGDAIDGDRPVVRRVSATLQSATSTQKELVELKVFLKLLGGGPQMFEVVMAELDRKWDISYVPMILESARFIPGRQRAAAFALLESKTGKNFGGDFDAWYQWNWKQEYEPHPEYGQFKAALYRRIDPRFPEYFQDTKNATIRLDEIRWGGVVRDGIPPLKNPKMLPAAEARYLGDKDVVFGIKLNGDARCYPKRILAWHEMFKDTIGGESVCGVY